MPQIKLRYLNKMPLLLEKYSSILKVDKTKNPIAEETNTEGVGKAPDRSNEISRRKF